MADNVFPYNLPSRQALIRLIQETHPRLNLKDAYCDFDDPYFSPTEEIPGRTFIEVEQTDLNIRRTYVYRRLDFGVTFSGGIKLKLDAPLTSRKIVDEINRTRGMTIGEEDVAVDDEEFGVTGMPEEFVLKAKSTSLVWFGSTVVTIEPLDRPENIRLLEDGTARLTEDGGYRLLEVE